MTWPSSSRSCARAGSQHPGCTPCLPSGSAPPPRPSRQAHLSRRARLLSRRVGPRARRGPPSTLVASDAAAAASAPSRLASASAPLLWVPTRWGASHRPTISHVASHSASHAHSAIFNPGRAGQQLCRASAYHPLQQRVGSPSTLSPSTLSYSKPICLHRNPPKPKH